MKKNVFSKSLAVIASAAVLSVASAFSASAAGESVAISDATGKAGESVTVNLSVAGGDLVAFGFSVVATPADTNAGSSNVAFVSGAKTTTASGATVDVSSSDAGADVLGYADAAAPIKGDLASLTYTIPADAKAGDTYTLSVSFANASSELVFGENDVKDSASLVAGTITVEADETPAVTTTTAATSGTTSSVDTETTVTTTTTKAKKTASPKTGSAGVAVAVAGLVTAAATAVVVKSRKD